MDEETDNASLIDEPLDEQGSLGNARAQIYMPSFKESDLKLQVSIVTPVSIAIAYMVN